MSEVPPAFSPVGERGPTGDTGRVGDSGVMGVPGIAGRTGDPGDPGGPGQRGPRGLTGRLPRRDPWTMRLFTLTALLVAMIVLLALAVTFRTQSNRNRVQDLLEEILESREEQIQDVECRNLFYDDIVFAYSRSIVNLNHLFAKAVQNPGPGDPAAVQVYRDEITGLVAAGDRQAAVVDDALAAYQDYVNVAPPPGVCPYRPPTATTTVPQP